MTQELQVKVGVNTDRLVAFMRRHRWWVGLLPRWARPRVNCRMVAVKAPPGEVSVLIVPSLSWRGA